MATTTAHDKLVFGMFALMAEYEAALIKERTQAGLIAARARGRHSGRKPKIGLCETGDRLHGAARPRRCSAPAMSSRNQRITTALLR